MWPLHEIDKYTILCHRVKSAKGATGPFGN